MLSTLDLERLIAVKKREIEAEKTLLGLASEITDNNNTTSSKDDTSKVNKRVQFSKAKIVTEGNDSSQESTERTEPETKREFEEIPADLERYIRRYLGLPVMLKAGEYSPNNPLIRGERSSGDVLLGLGEYERRRNTLRKIRQRQYREYLDQQAKIKQEAKEKAERERREREERDRLLEERQRQRERESELERDRYSPERRRASVNYTQVCGANNAYTTKVDTGVQVNNISKPLSVAVQTDDGDIFGLSPTPKNLLTQAERELSPRTVVDSKEDRPIHPASWTLKEQWHDVKHWKDAPKDWKDQPKDWKDQPKDWKDQPKDWKDQPKDWKDQPKDWKDQPKDWKDQPKDWKETPKDWKETKNWQDSGTDWKDPVRTTRAQDWKDDKWKDPEASGKVEKDWNELRRELESGDWKERGWQDGDLRELRHERRRSYGDFDERVKRASREKASSETRKYKPSIFDADAIELRNLQAEKEAAARRQFYQQELKNQILEQQRIREERKTREKMLEQAEMRRLEQQLRSLRVAQETEVDRQHRLDCKIRDDGIDYDSKRTTLQKEIDLEHQSLLRASSQANRKIAQTSKSDTFPSKLPFYYPKIQEKVIKTQEIDRLPYSTNISSNSVFAPNYDVESYLRRNLNPSRESLNSVRLDKEYVSDNKNPYYHQSGDNRNVIVEKALIHECPKPIERKKIDEKLPAVEHQPNRYECHPKVDEHHPKLVECHPKVNEHHPKLVERHPKSDVHPKMKEFNVTDPSKATKQSNTRDDSSETCRRVLKEDPLPIPVLRHSPKPRTSSAHETTDLSDAMKVVDDKWRVPVVQKNILKSSNESGKPVSILTQLGSIRRQLQLEQLKLDKMLSKDSDV